MKIVTDGHKFALARGFWIFTQLADLVVYGLWWHPNHYQSRDCWGTLEDAKNAYAFYKKTHRKWKDYRENKDD